MKLLVYDIINTALVIKKNLLLTHCLTHWLFLIESISLIKIKELGMSLWPLIIARSPHAYYIVEYMLPVNEFPLKYFKTRHGLMRSARYIFCRRWGLTWGSLLKDYVINVSSPCEIQTKTIFSPEMPSLVVINVQEPLQCASNRSALMRLFQPWLIAMWMKPFYSTVMS